MILFLNKILKAGKFFIMRFCACFVLFSSLTAAIPPETKENLFEIAVSGLYWQTKLWGMEFAAKSYVPLQESPNTLSYVQKLSIPDFSFSPGFKIEFGGGVFLDQFQLAARWTYLTSDLTNLKRDMHKRVVPEGEGVVPLWQQPQGVLPSNPIHFWKARHDWDLAFNSFDLELGRSFIPFSAMTVRVFLGAKGSYIKQQYQVKYREGTEFVPAVFYDRLTMVFHGTAAGAGPRAGFDSRWAIGWGFHLIADGAFSILFTSVGMGTKFQNQFSDASYDSSSHMREKEQELIPVLEGKLGFDWGKWFSSSFYFGMTLAYEAQYWWAQNHIRRSFAYQSPGNLWDMRGDLQLRGLTFSVRSEF